jgi:hypothetical protein
MNHLTLCNPTQLLIQGQWWSNLAMHLSQIEPGLGFGDPVSKVSKSESLHFIGDPLMVETVSKVSKSESLHFIGDPLTVEKPTARWEKTYSAWISPDETKCTLSTPYQSI